MENQIKIHRSLSDFDLLAKKYYCVSAVVLDGSVGDDFVVIGVFSSESDAIEFIKNCDDDAIIAGASCQEISMRAILNMMKDNVVADMKRLYKDLFDITNPMGL